MADPRHHLADPGHARTARDPRLDVLRGLCLVMIFINHVPGNALEVLTTRNFGFSDAAEGFVMMSGIAAGIAYGPDFRAPGSSSRNGCAPSNLSALLPKPVETP